MRLSHLLCAAFLGSLLVVGCQQTTTPPPASEKAPDGVLPDTFALASTADSIAFRMYRAHGAAGWNVVPYLRFSFGVGRGDTSQVVAQHLWNKETGAYRVEWDVAPESTLVALFDVDEVSNGLPTTGAVYGNGEPVDSARADSLLRVAYQRFINDSYWLLAPLKVFDEGVQRTYVPDSSTSEHAVIRLSFGDVGLTPGDRYWLYVDRATGLLDRWAFHLQGMPDTAAARAFDWTQTQPLETSKGPVLLSTRKEAAQGNMAIVFSDLSLPDSVGQSLFSAPAPWMVSR
ncbi:hypothetical protein [Salisaeta longa]|uniref:hypothetical protein n=1 Tax=Salisaeta longa TaxID=503170 RepID=UPI0004017476|nr:hypothetical protein [Salisaeta longa]